MAPEAERRRVPVATSLLRKPQSEVLEKAIRNSLTWTPKALASEKPAHSRQVSGKSLRPSDAPTLEAVESYQPPITSLYRFRTPAGDERGLVTEPDCAVGRGGDVGRGRGVGVALGVVVSVGVTVGVGVGVGAAGGWSAPMAGGSRRGSPSKSSVIPAMVRPAPTQGLVPRICKSVAASPFGSRYCGSAEMLLASWPVAACQSASVG